MIRILAVFFAVVVPIGILVLAGKLFEYCLWCLTLKDAPFLLDILGGCVTSPILIPASIIFAIMQSIGVSIPFIH